MHPRSKRIVILTSVAILTIAVLAVFLVPTALASDAFPDVPDSHWAHDFISWLFNNGITSGFPDGTYRPENNVSRAEMAVFIQQVAGAGSAGPVTDADKLDGLDSTAFLGATGKAADSDTLDGFDSSYFAPQGSLDSHDHMVAQGINLSSFSTSSSSYSEVIKVTLDIPDKCTSFFAPFDEHNVLVSASGYYLANGGATRAGVGVSMDDATSIQTGTRSDANIDSAANIRSPYSVHWLFTDVGSGVHDFRLLAREQGAATSIDLFDARLVVQQMGYSCGTLLITLEPETSEIPDP